MLISIVETCVVRNADFRAAIQDYSEAIQRDPEFAEAYFNRGLARLSQGDANREARFEQGRRVGYHQCL